MASAFTHAFVGASLLVAAPPRARGVALGLVLAVVAALPDLDVIAFRLGIPYGAPLGHRGLSHSLLFAVLLALVCAPLLARWLGKEPASDSQSKRVLLWLGLLLFTACASHGVLDAMTNAGLGVGFFLPLDDGRHFFAWRPLLTSPIGVTRFFGAQGVAILANEFRVVWLPLGSVLLLVALLRRWRDTRD